MLFAKIYENTRKKKEENEALVRRGRKPHLECVRDCGLKPGEKKAKERWDGRVKWLKCLLCLKGQIFSIVVQEVQGEEW